MAVNVDNANREWEASCKKALEGSIDDAKKVHTSKAEFMAAYREMEAQELHRHGQLCATVINLPLVPIVENARDICIKAAEKDEEWARQACERVKVPYNPEKDQPYSALALRTKARVLDAVIAALKRGDGSQGSPWSIVGYANKTLAAVTSPPPIGAYGSQRSYVCANQTPGWLFSA